MRWHSHTHILAAPMSFAAFDLPGEAGYTSNTHSFHHARILHVCTVRGIEMGLLRRSAI
jgi:hypothetical protein